MEFSDEELTVLDDILTDEVGRDHHTPSRKESDDLTLTSELFRKVRDEAKRRKLWWA